MRMTEGRGRVAELEEAAWLCVEAVADDLTVPPALLRKSSHVWSSSAKLSVGGDAWPRSVMIRITKGRAGGYPNLVMAMGRVSFYGGRAGIQRGERE